MAAQPATPTQFVKKWKAVDLPERAASQQHFIDLCRLLGQPTPADHDATGAEYALEKGVPVTDSASKGARGDRGFADAWWRDKFAWEYKRKDKYKDLTEAYLLAPDVLLIDVSSSCFHFFNWSHPRRPSCAASAYP